MSYLTYYFWISVIFGIFGALRNSRDTAAHRDGIDWPDLSLGFGYAFLLWPVFVFFEALTWIQFAYDRGGFYRLASVLIGVVNLLLGIVIFDILFTHHDFIYDNRHIIIRSLVGTQILAGGILLYGLWRKV